MVTDITRSASHCPRFVKRTAQVLGALLLTAASACGGGATGSKASNDGGLTDDQRTFVSGVRTAGVFPATATDQEVLRQGEIICANLKDGRTYEQESLRLDPHDVDDPATRTGRAIVMEGSIRYLCPEQR